MQPDSVPVELDRFSQKRVPVVPDVDVTFREGYGQSGPTLVVPESVTVSGAASVLGGITEWKTRRSVFADVRTPIEVDVALTGNDVYEVVTSTDRVRLSITVEPFAEKVFNGLPVEISTPPEDREVIFIPPKIEVVVRGGIKRLSSVGHGDFRITVPYSTVVADTSGIVEPTIVSPPGLQVVSKRPERVQYIVRKRV
jgi:hypothetical protein